MSHSGHFRAYGRRDVDLSASLEGPTDGASPDGFGSGRSSPADGRGSQSAIEPAPWKKGPAGGGSGAKTSNSSGRDRSKSWPSDRPSQPPPGRGTRIRVVNLSLGGACVEGATLREGAEVTIEILAPTLWDPLVLRGLVVWTKSEKAARAGVSFEHDDPARAFALLELLGAHDYDV